ncbi:trypsin-like peptidase domain-containing protein [Micromonospora sp. NPDC048830]|uniref:trypsin-like peptidase domain-containing protein n=1 Tax=Micromonospora sp. NPDC048830 TaxID=3364257 RepID=UPI00371551D9
MQPVGPYRFTETSGVCQVGRAWWAVDGQDRLVTVAVLEGAAAADPPWREAFTNAANTLAQTPGGHRYLNADFAAAQPWVAYPSEEDGAAQRLFQMLGMQLRPEGDEPQPGWDATVALPTVVPTQPVPAVTPVHPVSGGPMHPVSGGPMHPVSGGPMHPVSGGPMHPVSGGPVHPVSGGTPYWGPQPVATGHPVSGVPVSGGTPFDPTAATQDPFASPQRRIQPSAPERRSGGSWIGAAVLAVLLVAVSGGLVFWTKAAGRGGDAAPAAPTTFSTTASVDVPLKPWTTFGPYSPEERALAAAAPSLVFLETVVTGYLRDSATNAPLGTKPITVNRRCSGFVVSTKGHVLTSSSCVRPPDEVTREGALDSYADDLVDDHKLTSAQVDEYVQDKLPATSFTGQEPGSQPTVQVYGQLNSARGSLTVAPAVPGQIVEALPAEQGGAAVVKLLREDLPAVELNTSSTLKAGAPLLTVGFRLSDSSSTYTPRARIVTVTDVAQSGSVSIYRVDGDPKRISHGGMALDPSGRVVGILDEGRDEARPDSANDVVIPAATGAALLDKVNVDNALGAADERYRDGLDAYFGGEQPAAVAAFDRVAKESPANLLAQAYRENAAQRQKLEGDSSGQPAWVTVSVAALGGALIAGLVVGLVVLFRRRRQG